MEILRKGTVSTPGNQVKLRYFSQCIIYDKPFNESFTRKIEIVQYKTALMITDAIKRNFP